jgi:phosphate transport system substrate-binding protein
LFSLPNFFLEGSDVKFNKRKTCMAVALAVSALGSIPAMAVTLIGGGSSLVGPSITAEIAAFGADPDSLTYYITSSGTGQTAFLNNNASYFASGLTGQVFYANSDAAVSSSYVTAYNTSDEPTDGPLIQIPYIVTPITIPYVNGPTSSSDTLSGPQTTPGQTSSLALNDSDLCGIFSGNYTNWNQVTNPDTGTTFNLSAPIKVIYRSDSSGTSELLTRHLAAVCPSYSSTASGVTFVDSTTFAASFPSGVPTTFTGVSGSGNIQAALVAAESTSTGAPSAIAYLSPDWTNTFLAPSSSSASVDLSVASLRNTTLNADIAPTYQQATAALGTVSAPSTQATAADPTQWVPNAANPTTGYPVSGTSQILLSQCYATSPQTTTVLNFLNAHYTVAANASIINGNGFATVPAAYETAIDNDFLTNESGYNLNIAQGKQTGSCSAFTGR